jgi:hypothetical protein
MICAISNATNAITSPRCGRNRSDEVGQAGLTGGRIESAGLSRKLRYAGRLLTGSRVMVRKNERVELEIRIKYRSWARRLMHYETVRRISLLVAELEQKLREIDE